MSEYRLLRNQVYVYYLNNQNIFCCYYSFLYQDKLIMLKMTDIYNQR